MNDLVKIAGLDIDFVKAVKRQMKENQLLFQVLKTDNLY